VEDSKVRDLYSLPMSEQLPEENYDKLYMQIARDREELR
jgi:hypothetical protein